jgi:G3E family GTPase
MAAAFTKLPEQLQRDWMAMNEERAAAAKHAQEHAHDDHDHHHEHTVRELGARSGHPERAAALHSVLH